VRPRLRAEAAAANSVAADSAAGRGATATRTSSAAPLARARSAVRARSSSGFATVVGSGEGGDAGTKGSGGALLSGAAPAAAARSGICVSGAPRGPPPSSACAKSGFLWRSGGSSLGPAGASARETTGFGGGRTRAAANARPPNAQAPAATSSRRGTPKPTPSPTVVAAAAAAAAAAPAPPSARAVADALRDSLRDTLSEDFTESEGCSHEGAGECDTDIDARGDGDAEAEGVAEGEPVSVAARVAGAPPVPRALPLRRALLVAEAEAAGERDAEPLAEGDAPEETEVVYDVVGVALGVREAPPLRLAAARLALGEPPVEEGSALPVGGAGEGESVGIAVGDASVEPYADAEGARLPDAADARADREASDALAEGDADAEVLGAALADAEALGAALRLPPTFEDAVARALNAGVPVLRGEGEPERAGEGDAEPVGEARPERVALAVTHAQAVALPLPAARLADAAPVVLGLLLALPLRALLGEPPPPPPRVDEALEDVPADALPPAVREGLPLPPVSDGDALYEALLLRDALREGEPLRGGEALPLALCEPEGEAKVEALSDPGARECVPPVAGLHVWDSDREKVGSGEALTEKEAMELPLAKEEKDSMGVGSGDVDGERIDVDECEMRALAEGEGDEEADAAPKPLREAATVNDERREGDSLAEPQPLSDALRRALALALGLPLGVPLRAAQQEGKGEPLCVALGRALAEPLSQPLRVVL
jgi:hypothetical protein